MRAILFRGKGVFSGRWVVGSLVHQTDDYGDACDDWLIVDGTTTDDNHLGYSYYVDTETVGQYIGMNDADGIKIFEGDILEASYYEDISGTDTKYRGFVKWNKGCWMFYEKGAEIPDAMSDFLPDDARIIGNIYENPELMEDEP